MSRKQKKVSNHIIPYCIGGAQASMSYYVVSNLSFALTDSYGMAAVLVGTIFLASRIFDGITDIFAGYVIDKTHTKWGKARPFDLFSIPMWILLVLCFNVPDFQGVGKVIWVFLTYNLCQSICYTFVTVATTVRLKRSFREEVRSKVVAATGLTVAVIATASSVIFPILISIFQDQPHGWTIIIGFFAVPGIIMSLIQFFFVPEIEADGRQIGVNADAAVTGENAGSVSAETQDLNAQQKISVRESVKALFSNKYIFIVALAVIALTMANTVNSTAGNYYYKYVVNDLSKLSIVSMFSLVGYVLLVFMPLLTRKLGNRKCMMLAFTLIVIFSGMKYMFRTNVAGLAVCACLTAIGVTLGTCVRDLLVIDCMKYGQYMTGNSNYEGIYSSVKGFSDKVAMGFTSIVVGIVLEIGRYDGAAAVQSELAQKAIQFTYAGLPLILGLIGLIVMTCYGLEKKLKSIEEAKQPAAE